MSWRTAADADMTAVSSAVGYSRVCISRVAIDDSGRRKTSVGIPEQPAMAAAMSMLPARNRRKVLKALSSETGRVIREVDNPLVLVELDDNRQRPLAADVALIRGCRGKRSERFEQRQGSGRRMCL